MFSPRVLIGSLMAIYFLVGRWTFSRMSSQDTVDWYWEPRLWLLLILAAVVLLEQPLWRGAAGGRPSEKPKFGLYFLLTLALLAYLIESAHWSPNPMLAQDKVYETGLVILMVILLFLSLRHGYGDAIRTEFWKTLVLLTGMMAALALANTATERLAILGGGPNAFGRNMGFLVLGTLYLSRRSGPQWFGLWWAIAAVGVMLVLLSGSRGAMAAAAVSAVVYQVVDRQPLSKRIVLFIGTSLVAAFILTQTEFGRKAQEAFAYRVLYLTFNRQHTSGRTGLYLQAYEIGVENPVLGVGLNGYRHHVGIYPHNLFLEAFSEGGSIGLALLLAVLANGGIGLLRIRARLNAATVAAAAHAFTSAQFSGDFYDGRGIFLLLAFALIPDPVRPPTSQPRAHAATPKPILRPHPITPPGRPRAAQRADGLSAVQESSLRTGRAPGHPPF